MRVLMGFSVLLALGAGLPVRATAESLSCTAPEIIVTDGRLTQSTFPDSTTYWFGIYAQANHSYSAEFVPSTDNYYNTTKIRIATLAVYGPNDTLQSCRGNSSVVVTQNSGYAPVIQKGGNGMGRRISFTAPSSGLYLICVTNLAGAGTYAFRAVDTTLISVRWNTSGGYDTLWTLLNVSDMPITGTLYLLDMGGQVLTAVPLSISPGGRVAHTSATTDLNLPRNSAGIAMFSHNGPPDSILAEAFLNGPTLTVPEKFESVPVH